MFVSIVRAFATMIILPPGIRIGINAAFFSAVNTLVLLHGCTRSRAATESAPQQPAAEEWLRIHTAHHLSQIEPGKIRVQSFRPAS